MRFFARQRQLTLACALALLSNAPAQETVHYASVSGRVTDPAGGVVNGAEVIIRQTDTNVSGTILTGRDGSFRFPYLRIGPYEVTVRQPGFAAATRRLTLTVGSAFDLPIALAVESKETSIVVNAEAPVLESARSQVAGTVSSTEVRNLPLNGRNFLDLALLIPGVSPTNTGSNQLFPETSAVAGQGISVGSQRNFSNNFIVDGLSANDDAAGLSGLFYGLDVVGEFQVITSGAQAELGRALGGYINVVTKSGTNSLHADLYGYFRNQRMNAANPLSNSKLPLTQSQYGASLGGPIRQDRTFFFTNMERRDLNQSGLTTITAANIAPINARLDAVGYKGPRIATGIYPNPVHNTSFLVKADHQFSTRDQFNIRYSLYDVTSSNSRGAGALNAPSASSGLDNTDQAIAFGNVFTISPRTVNETRGQYSRGNLQALPTDTIGPSVSISGVATFGTLSGSPHGRLNDLYEIVDNLSFHAGAHAIRIGGSFLYNDTTITYPRSYRGAYTFSSLATFLSGAYNASGFTQTFGDPVIPQTNPNVGFYAQDEWRVRPGFTLNAGLRYDLQFLETINTDRNNFSPRVGFAWSPGARNTVVRASYGLFYDRVPLRAVANALLSAGNTTDLSKLRQTSISLSPAQAGAPVFPNILSAATPSVTLVNLTTMDRNLQNAYSQQASLEIERRIWSGATLGVGFQHLRGLHLVASINQNVPSCAAAGTNNGCRPNPSYANNSQYSSQADSNYNALHVSFVQRPASWGNYRISYAYSKSLNNVGETFFASPINPFNIWKDYGRSDDDQRHRVVFNGTVHTSTGPAQTIWQRLSHGFQLGMMLQYYSALPMNITSGVTSIQGTAGRPIVNGDYIGRNTGTGNDLFTAGARLDRTFALTERWRLELIAEGFNVLNHRNNLTRNGNFGAGAYPSSPSATFGQVTAVNDPRTVQLALRLRF